jgi:isopentenyl diphosphate isomerase/L-lactate dehydrogenase-like FMN-dependent dehydrogenase
MGEGISEEDDIEAIILGCKEKGIIGCTGDGVADFIHETGLSVIKKAQGYGIPFIKPWEQKELSAKIDKVRKCGADSMGIDIDAAGLITLKKMGRPVTPKTVAELAEIRQSLSIKFILKGIMTVTDARLAVEAGADAIVVSNHGGRVLDFTPGVASVLPDICAAVKGKITILADGGVRTGGDVLKLLALGADAVMIGRPLAIAAVGGRQKGVAMYIDKIATELEQAMVLTGVPTINDVSRDILHNF